LLTGDTVFATVFIHTVNKKAQQHRKTLQMKTKTLLIAAAALAAGVISSQAQVYSQNIVGYVNVLVKGANSYTLIANPLDDGNGNQLTNIIGGLPAGSSITTWGGAVFNTPVGKTAGGWATSIPLPPGVGFFVKNGKASPVSPDYTNTFVGSVLASAGGGMVTNALALGYNLVGSQLPYGGDITTDTNLNLQVPAQSSLTSWNTANQLYDTPVGKTVGGWASSFNVTVGEGFFLKEGKYATNWVQTLQ
jgi:hypothetical protein